MNKQNFDENTLKNIQSEMIRYLTEEKPPIVEASSDDLVSIKMDSHFHIDSVTIQGVKLNTTEIARLEHAVLKAVNNAIQEVTKRSVNHLAKSIQHAAKPEKGSS